MTPPHTDPMSVTHTNPNSLPTLPSFADPDADEKGDEVNMPSDAPGFSTAPIEDRAVSNGCHEGEPAAGKSSMLHQSKFMSVPKFVSIDNR